MSDRIVVMREGTIVKELSRAQASEELVMNYAVGSEDALSPAHALFSYEIPQRSVSIEASLSFSYNTHVHHSRPLCLPHLYVRTLTFLL